MGEGEELFDLTTVAGMLNITVQTVRSKVRSGQLAGVNIGGIGHGARWRVSASAIDNYMQAASSGGVVEDPGHKQVQVDLETELKKTGSKVLIRRYLSFIAALRVSSELNLRV